MDLSSIKQPVLDGDAQATVAAATEAVAAGVSPSAILTEALIPAMEEVGNLFACGEYFVPELLMAARAMSAAVEVLRPSLVTSGYEAAGTVVIGTVQGDLHDIGKRLVAMMLEGSGFDVVDLGTDVAPEQFIAAARDSGAAIIALSALLSTTLPAMQSTVEALRAAALGDTVRVIVGGAPVTDEFARRIGADGYAPDAPGAAALARRLVRVGGEAAVN
ncbi:MAG: corrinoid protein [Deltaproteobacteria bacterium]|nr:corrinoid protein [Deltaproteobacteria bacterium]